MHDILVIHRRKRLGATRDRWQHWSVAETTLRKRTGVSTGREAGVERHASARSRPRNEGGAPQEEPSGSRSRRRKPDAESRGAVRRSVRQVPEAARLKDLRKGNERSLLRTGPEPGLAKDNLGGDWSRKPTCGSDPAARRPGPGEIKGDLGRDRNPLEAKRRPYPGMADGLETVGVGGDTSPHYCMRVEVVLRPGGAIWPVIALR